MASTYYVAGIPYSSEDSLCHFGIKGQKWGIRRYQNPDGSLTAAGKARYGSDVTKMPQKNLRRQFEESKKAGRLKKYEAEMDKTTREINRTKEYKEYSNLGAGLQKFRQELATSMGVRPEQIVFDDATAMRYKLAQHDYMNKAREIYEVNKDKIASALMEDMEWDVTSQGLDYVKKHLGF